MNVRPHEGAIKFKRIIGGNDTLDGDTKIEAMTKTLEYYKQCYKDNASSYLEEMKIQKRRLKFLEDKIPIISNDPDNLKMEYDFSEEMNTQEITPEDTELTFQEPCAEDVDCVTGSNYN